MTISDYMVKAIWAALKAGEAILEIYGTGFSVEYKEDSSPLTSADKASHAIIKTELKDCGLPLLSEEGRGIPFEERKDWELFWMIDPIDGTKEFIKRNGEFTVNIALIRDGGPIAGVVYAPVPDRLYLGLEGKGSFRIEKAAYGYDKSGAAEGGLDRFLAAGDRLPDHPLPQDGGVSVVASRSHFSAETEAYVKELESRYDRVDLTSAGSSLKLCLIAEGKAQIYPRFAPTMEWDTAAGQVVVEQSGGSVERRDDGKRLACNKADLLNPWFIARRKGFGAV